MSRVMVAAHRGVAAGAAENTIEAFTNAIAIGADMIEFDVRMTRDGELIAFHDARVNGIAVGSLTRDDIEAGAGVPPPLPAPAPRARPGPVTALKAISDPGEFIVTSFLPSAGGAAKIEFPQVKTGLLVGGSARWAGLPTSLRELFPVGLARQVRADYLAPHYTLDQFGTVSRAAAAGLPCLLWTVNADSDIRAFAADPRIAAIITDRAERALAIVAGAT